MDFRIRYIHQQELRSDYRKDRNASRARNKGIRISKGKYIATLDDDDFWCDQRKLEKQVQFLENHPDYVVCGGGVVVIREENPEKPFLRPYYPEKDEDIRKRMLFGDAHVHSSLVFRKEVWETIGGYDEKLPFGDDWNFYLRLGKVGKLYNFPEYFTYFLLGQQNKTDRVEYKRESLGVSIRFIKKYRNDYPGFPKAILLAWACYFYSFLPFGESLRPVFVKIKHRIFDPFLYK